MKTPLVLIEKTQDDNKLKLTRISNEPLQVIEEVRVHGVEEPKKDAWEMMVDSLMEQKVNNET
jgi:hypothetical protein